MSTLSQLVSKHFGEWRGAVEMGAVRRQAFIPEVRGANEAKRQITFVASTETPDRYSDVIRVDGWDTKAYMQNPVVLWAHKSGELPVGKTVEIHTEKAPKPALVHTVQFADHPLADQVLNLYRGKFLNSVSVGFRPTAAPTRIIDPETNAWEGGYEFNGTELLEISCVPVPANPEALARAVASGAVSKDAAARFFLADDIEKAAREELSAVIDDLTKSLRELRYYMAVCKAIAAVRELEGALGFKPYRTVTPQPRPAKRVAPPEKISSLSDLERALRGAEYSSRLSIVD